MIRRPRFLLRMLITEEEVYMSIQKMRLAAQSWALAGCVSALALSSLTSTMVRAEEGPSVPTVRAKFGGSNRWENGLDIKVTSLYEKKMDLSGSSPLILTAQWNRKFESQSFIGLSLSSMAQPTNGPFSDLKSKVITYYGGLNFAQSLFEKDAFRITANVSAGLGSLFLRTEEGTTGSRMARADYRYIEPGALVTFFEYAGLEFGVVGSYRSIKLIKDFTLDGRNLGKSADFSSQAFGLTFRTQRF